MQFQFTRVPPAATGRHRALNTAYRSGESLVHGISACLCFSLHLMGSWVEVVILLMILSTVA